MANELFVIQVFDPACGLWQTKHTWTPDTVKVWYGKKIVPFDYAAVRSQMREAAEQLLEQNTNVRIMQWVALSIHCHGWKTIWENGEWK